MQQAEERRHKEKCGDGGKQKAADNRAPQGCILLAAFAPPERHGQHADDHCERGHENGPEASEAGQQSGIRRRVHIGQLFLGKAHHQNAVGRCHAHAHDRPGQCRNAHRCMRQEQEPDDTRERGGQRRNDDEWVKPRLKIDDDKHVDQDDGEGETANQALERRPHRLDLPAHYNARPPHQVFTIALRDLVDLPGHASQVRILHRAINIDHWGDVVVGHCGKPGSAAKIGQARQNLW